MTMKKSVSLLSFILIACSSPVLAATQRITCTNRLPRAPEADKNVSLTLAMDGNHGALATFRSPGTDAPLTKEARIHAEHGTIVAEWSYSGDDQEQPQASKRYRLDIRPLLISEERSAVLGRYTVESDSPTGSTPSRITYPMNCQSIIE